MPNSKLHPSPIGCPGIILLGDAYNMRHPLTGGGMTVALSDVVVLSNELANVDFNDLAQVKKAIKQWHMKRKPLACTVNILAHALYSLFAANSKCT